MPIPPLCLRLMIAPTQIDAPNHLIIHPPTMKVLVTGATGNIGKRVIASLRPASPDFQLIAAVRTPAQAASHFAGRTDLAFRHFDFEDASTFSGAFQGIDLLFLLRPPHLSAVKTYFLPLLEAAKAAGISRVVFLSVQGAEKSKVIPHNQIEGLIQSLGFSYIFVRPSYFMQNLTTTLLPEIQQHRTITLPSGTGKFNWVDTHDIGAAIARLIEAFEVYQNNSYEITGTENLSFGAVVSSINAILSTQLTYKSVNPIRFYRMKRKQGISSGFVWVMTLLHFLPRVQAEPQISNAYYLLTGHQPTSLRAFIEREKAFFLPPTR